MCHAGLLNWSSNADGDVHNTSIKNVRWPWRQHSLSIIDVIVLYSIIAVSDYPKVIYSTKLIGFEWLVGGTVGSWQRIWRRPLASITCDNCAHFIIWKYERAYSLEFEHEKRGLYFSFSLVVRSSSSSSLDFPPFLISLWDNLSFGGNPFRHVIGFAKGQASLCEGCSLLPGSPFFAM